MNQRIRELAEQAEEYAYIHDGIRIPILNPEMFAQLVARECHNIAQTYDYPKMAGPGTIIANRIYEHFKV